MVFYRLCPNCTSTHKTIYYQRITPIPAGFSIYYAMIKTWTSPYNLLNVDFKLYSSYSDYSNGINAWTTCNYDNIVPFPRECGPSGNVLNQWTGQSPNARNYAYFIGAPPPTTNPTPQPTVAQASLTHQYTFNDGTATDLIGGSNWNGILGTGTQISGGSLRLTGASTSFMKIPANALSGSNVVTIETWVTSNSNSGWCTVFQWGASQSTKVNSAFLLRSTNNKIALQIYPTNVASVTILSNFNFDSQVNAHIVAIFVPGSSVTLFVNNNYFMTSWSAASIPPSTAFYLGYSFDQQPMFVGAINEFRIYNGALTDSQVFENYVKGPVISTQAPTPTPSQPTLQPTPKPTAQPNPKPTPNPTQMPTMPLPTRKPSPRPTRTPTRSPSISPTLLASLTVAPTPGPTMLCSAGKYFNSSLTACVLCPAGTSNQLEGGLCTPCAKGWMSTAGSSVCSICPGGTYSSSVGSVTCLECSSGRKSTAGSWNCTTCSRGYYASEQITNVLPYKGYLYATLSNGPVDDSNDYCQTAYVTMPYGWTIAPDTLDSRRVIGAHSWSTDVVIVATGYAYSTSTYSPYPGTNQSCCGNCLQSDGSGSSLVEPAYPKRNVSYSFYRTSPHHSLVNHTLSLFTYHMLFINYYMLFINYHILFIPLPHALHQLLHALHQLSYSVHSTTTCSSSTIIFSSSTTTYSSSTTTCSS